VVVKDLSLSRFLKLALELFFVFISFANIIKILEEVARLVSFAILVLLLSQIDSFFVLFLLLGSLLLDLLDHESITNLGNALLPVFLLASRLLVLEMASDLPLAMSSLLALLLLRQLGAITHRLGVDLEHLTR
jgi:hypothetical protein